MEDLESRSYGGEGRMEMEMEMEMEMYGGSRVGHNDFRCYSTSSYVPSSHGPKEKKLKKGKSTSGSSSSYSSGKGGCWSLSDPELQRKRRVAGYKVYSVEGKMKASFRKTFRWLKDRYTQVLHGKW